MNLQRKPLIIPFLILLFAFTAAGCSQKAPADVRIELETPDGSDVSDSNAVFSGKDGVVAEKPMFFFLERYMMAYAKEVDSFVEAIVNDTETEVNAKDGLEPVLIGLAAKKSVAEHRPVRIEEIRSQYGL